jgi:hypothetical protein
MPAPSDQRDVPRASHDPVNYPAHYRSHPSGVECIEITEHLNFCIGNAIKYLWRCDDKDDALQNLAKARWYIDREIERRRRISGLASSAPRPVGGAS